MTKCMLLSYAVPISPQGGEAKSVCQCTVHNWTFDYFTSVTTSCPVGRIEEATEAAIERIKEATRE